MPKELTIELAETTKTSKVMYADAPLKLSKSPQEITVDELYQKVSHPFSYSDTLFSREKHAPYLKKEFKSKKSSTSYFTKKFKQLGLTDISSLVICNMGQLGHGVFANKDFEAGECFILYAGVITDSAHSNNNSAYDFSYHRELSLYVDATETGNISRFIQHMPLNFNLHTDDAQSEPDYDKNLEENSKESSDFWQWKNIDYRADLTEDQVAWANLSMMVLPLQGVPGIILYNTRKINKGNQLGVSYGRGYWSTRMKPELFDLTGNVIPETKYGYKEISINLPFMERFKRSFPEFQQKSTIKSYDAVMFQSDLKRQQEMMQPVFFSLVTEPVSIFKLRELLLEYNVIGKEYGPIEDPFVSRLRSVLSKEFTIEMFERDPSHKSSKPIYDVVCSTDDLIKWSQLTLLLKGPMIDNYSTIKNKCLKLTQEVILMDIGNNISDQFFLLNFLMRSQIKDFFTKTLPEEQIPLGPRRGDPNGVIAPTSEEAISQILLHNPSLTRKELSELYKEMAASSGAITNSDFKTDSLIKNSNEIKLNAITASFFNNKAPANWKAYPSERLVGKYIGHKLLFFTMPAEQVTQATSFFNTLKQNGFEAELKKANDKPSITVDLTS